MYSLAKMPATMHNQNPRVAVTIIVANADNATMRYVDPHHGSLVILYADLWSRTLQRNMTARMLPVILG